MTARATEVPFVVGSDGAVFVNVMHGVTGEPDLGVLLERARSERGRVLIVVELDPREVRTLLARLGHGASEAVAFALGLRRRRRRLARRKRPHQS